MTRETRNALVAIIDRALRRRLDGGWKQSLFEELQLEAGRKAKASDVFNLMNNVMGQIDSAAMMLWKARQPKKNTINDLTKETSK